MEVPLYAQNRIQALRRHLLVIGDVSSDLLVVGERTARLPEGLDATDDRVQGRLAVEE